MTPIRGLVLILVMTIVAAPAASAASSLGASSLEAVGDARLEGDAGALFFLSQDLGVSWDATAAHATLERRYVEYLAVEHPLYPEDNLYREFKEGSQPRVETLELDAAALTSGAHLPLGALLVRGEPGASGMVAQTSLGLFVAAVTDPSLDQGRPPDVSVSDPVTGAQAEFQIHERLEGDYLNATLAAATVELVGTLVLDIYGLDYTLSHAQGTLQARTGDVETGRTGNVVEGRIERHRLVLTDAVLRVRAPTQVHLFSAQPVVSVDGLLGPLGDAADAAGPGTYALSPTDGLVSAAPAGDAGVASGAASLRQGPRLPWVAAAVAAICVLALLGLALARRARGDDLELALLAMEERRWDDALPRLQRVLAKRPHDAALMVDRAICLEETGRVRDAAKGLEAALRQAPKNAEAHYYYARVLAKLREAGPSLAHLQEALALDPRLGELATREAAFRALAHDAHRRT